MSAASIQASDESEWTAVESSTGTASVVATAMGAAGAAVTPTPAEDRWARLIRAVRQVRKLQFYFSDIGKRLQDFAPALRDRVKKAYPRIKE